MKVAAVIPTFNRRSCLKKCIDALLKQSYPLSAVIVVDNASTDSTWEYLLKAKEESGLKVVPLRLGENKGSAGGFKEGLQYGQKMGFEAFWLIDDDAVPRADALEKLLASNSRMNEKVVVGSVMLDPGNNGLSWYLIGCSGKDVYLVDKLHGSEQEFEVMTLPYTGIMLTPEALRTAGYPLESLFIWCDDAEYCLRLKSAGYRFFAVPSSIIYHQRQETAVKNIGVWKVIYYPTVQPQKYYYHVRNSIYIAGRYYGRIPWLKQVAGLLLQFVLTAIKHKEPKEIIKYFILGFWDAMRGRYGMKASKSDSRTPGLP